MKINVESGSYRLDATRQANPSVWLIREYSGNQPPISTYADDTGGLVKTLASLLRAECDCPYPEPRPGDESRSCLIHGDITSNAR